MNKSKYIAKAKDSFKTKKNLFLFNLAIRQLNEFSDDDFISFEIDIDMVKTYVNEYWQEFEDHKISDITVKEISQNIEELSKLHKDQLELLQKNYIVNFSNIYPEDEFQKLLQKDECHYCKITTKQIETLGTQLKLNKKSFRGWSLEIDRLNSNFEYKPDNCVMACYWCNNAKTDEFTEKEFLIIAEGIKQVWKDRLEDDCR